ncbi:MAG: DUF1553 domain-containing protein [Planctomycetales bacterium]|nr:DUF1553 domain-containing protein [Planctomycetales bacterium]
MKTTTSTLLLTCCLALHATIPGIAKEPAIGSSSDDPSGQGAELFESKIRPALIEHCLECHSTGTDVGGGLLLDSRDGWSAGGDLGAAIVPGDPTSSLLIKAIEYNDPNLQMPPDGKLDDQVIAEFRRWIQTGAVDPRQAKSVSAEPMKPTGLSVQRALEHWAYRPLSDAPAHQSHLGETHSEGTDLGASVIDRLINQRIRETGLTPAAEADRRVLVRRLAFDLHGLPPSSELVESFLSDTSPLAYERLVDDLLASPHFAEHFARHWMDVVRYAESITLRGFILPEAWRYRDYLVESFASDRPVDQMIRDQIAGDLMAVDDLEETRRRAIATGFLAFGNSNLEDQDKTKLEFDHIDEQLETMGRAFLAQTIGCARCHDHKFDPIPTRDYYALAAIMRSTTPLKHANLSKWIEKPLPLDAETESHYRQLESQVAGVTARLEAIKSIVDDRSQKIRTAVPLQSLDGIVVDDSAATLAGNWVESTFVKPYVGSGYRHDETQGQGSKTATFDPVDLATGNYEVRMSYTAHENRATNVQVKVFSANESATIIVNQRKTPPDDGLWLSLGVFPFEKGGQSFVIVSNEDANGCVIVDAIQFIPVDQGDAVKPKTNSADADVDKQAAVAERKELSARLKRLQAEIDERPKYLTISESEPRREIAVRIRGNVHQPGESVSRGFLSAIGPRRDETTLFQSGSGRVELANWIADSENPLTARVYANRVWSWLMGDGLVATENNFGTTGLAPSHPELLDLLARELIGHDWSTKHLVRTIVCSDAYRRSVTDDPDRIATDPNNRLYASGRIKRLPVEAIRDTMLIVSGELDRTMGGSLIRPDTASDYEYEHGSARRSVYWPVFRNSLPPLFETFDFADSSVSVGQRSQSTIAPQSLAMMNHQWIIDRARHSGRRYRDAFAALPAGPSGANPKQALIRQIYHDCFGRPPDPAELDMCLSFLDAESESSDEDRVVDLIQSLFASIDFRYLE